MARRLPNASLTIYPDSGHGGVFQYHEQFVPAVVEFLGALTATTSRGKVVAHHRRRRRPRLTSRPGARATRGTGRARRHRPRRSTTRCRSARRATRVIALEADVTDLSSMRRCGAAHDRDLRAARRGRRQRRRPRARRDLPQPHDHRDRTGDGGQRERRGQHRVRRARSGHRAPRADRDHQLGLRIRQRCRRAALLDEQGRRRPTRSGPVDRARTTRGVGDDRLLRVARHRHDRQRRRRAPRGGRAAVTDAEVPPRANRPDGRRHRDRRRPRDPSPTRRHATTLATALRDAGHRRAGRRQEERTNPGHACGADEAGGPRPPAGNERLVAATRSTPDTERDVHPRCPTPSIACPRDSPTWSHGVSRPWDVARPRATSRPTVPAAAGSATPWSAGRCSCSTSSVDPAASRAR